MLGEFSIFHWLVVFAIVLVVFGPNKLPELAKAAGKGIRDFKKALAEDDSEIKLGPSTLTENSHLKIVPETETEATVRRVRS